MNREDLVKLTYNIYIFRTTIFIYIGS